MANGLTARPLASLVLGCALLGGCASLAPPDARPPLPVPNHYPMPASPSAAAAPPEWRAYFAAPALRALIALALDNNRDLRVAALRVEQARAAYGIERAAALPTLAAQAGGQRQRVPADLSLTGRSLISSQYQAGVGVGAWELDFWGRLASLRQAALEDYLASDAARRAVTVALIAQVAEAYYEVREMDQRIALAQRTLATRRESYRIFDRRAAVGATSRLNVAQVETLLLQAQALTAQLQQERDLKRHTLQLLVGAPLPATGDAANNDADAGDSLPALAAGLPSALLERRADVIAAEHQLKAAGANIGAARAAFFPQLSLTGSLGTASAELGQLFGAGSAAWSFAPAITLPLFDGGRRRANLSLAEARRDSAVATYEKTIQQAFREVADALSARAWLADQIVVSERALRVQRERARLSQLRYDNGAAPFLDVLDAQRELLGAEQQLVQLRRALLSAGIALYTALGGDPVIATGPTPPASAGASSAPLAPPSPSFSLSPSPSP
jgi:multidrug efflux system outer membrane protein